MSRNAPTPSRAALGKRRLEFSPRRLLHSFAYFLASFLVLAVFFIAMVLAESSFYAITGHSVSTWALILAALAAALLFSPLVATFQRGLDRLFFRHHLDTLAAIRHLGAGDLAEIPDRDVEQSLLARICSVSNRRSAALDERRLVGGEIHCHPRGHPPPLLSDDPPPLRLPEDGPFELCIRLPRRQGDAFLFLGAHTDGRPTDDDEIETLLSLAQFAAMSLEHARLSHQHAEMARLDSITRVASQLHSHDLKNRLHDLSFLAHNLGAGGLDAGEADRLVGAIRKVIGRMQTLFRRLADPEAPLHPSLAPLDVAQLVHECVEERLWPEGVHIHTELPPLPQVSGDRDMLRGVLETLFDNAVQAMQSKGDIHIAARQTEKFVEIQVHDNGCGMSPEFAREHLFKIFSTTKSDGLGIGLYLSRRIIEAHGGTITAESGGEGKGCTFWMHLPLWHSGGGEGKD